MKLNKIEYKELAPNYHVITAIIKVGITNIYTLNEFKTKTESLHFKRKIEELKEEVLNHYYFFPKTYVVPKKIMDKWYDICDIRFKLYAKKA